MVPRIAILDDYQDVALKSADWASLAGRTEVVALRARIADRDERVRQLSGFDVVVANRERTRIDAALIDSLPRLKLIVTSGMRNASIDIGHAAARGIPVSGTATLGYPTAELTWGLILAFERNLVAEANAVRNGGWQTMIGRGLHGRTLGIAGYGRIGGKVAKVAIAFGMTVLAWSRSLTQDAAAAQGVSRVDFDDLLRESDIVTLHLPLNASTRGRIGAAEIGLMKPDALLINTARGELIDEGALAEALRARRIRGAALDVFGQEPLEAGSALVQLDNALLTPHLGYVIEENYRLTFGQCVENIQAWLDGSPIRVLG